MSQPILEESLAKRKYTPRKSPRIIIKSLETGFQVFLGKDKVPCNINDEIGILERKLYPNKIHNQT